MTLFRETQKVYLILYGCRMSVIAIFTITFRIGSFIATQKSRHVKG